MKLIIYSATKEEKAALFDCLFFISDPSYYSYWIKHCHNILTTNQYSKQIQFNYATFEGLKPSDLLKYFFNKVGIVIGKPTEVSCEVFIRSFGSISEKTMVTILYFDHFHSWCSKYFLRTIKWICIWDSIGLIQDSITLKSNRWKTLVKIEFMFFFIFRSLISMIQS